jgi:predicted MFS family arabinose efflux permease
MMSAMASATFLGSCIGILAGFLLDDLGINRTQIGALIAVWVIVSAVASPVVGTVTDALGGRRSLAGLFVMSVIGFLGLAVAPTYWVMFIPVVLAAVGQAAANPATNKLIAQHAPPGRRGVVTGVKQSGVPAGVFLGGVVIPSLALAIGWRWALVVVAVVPLIALPAGLRLLPRNREETGLASRAAVRGPVAPSIRFLAVYGALMGFGAAHTFLVPLFVEEGLGLGTRVGGLAAGLTGLAGFFGRIVWAKIAEVWVRYDRVLLVMAVVSVVAAGCYLAATWAGSWAVWLGVLLTGLSSSSWNSVAMLAVMDEAGAGGAGRASGVVMLGFLAGLGAAPTLFGWSVDITGSYTTMWVLSIGALTAAVFITVGWLRRVARR